MSVTTGSILIVLLIAQLAGGGLGLGEVQGDVLLVEEHLALKVVGFDKVSVDQADRTDACPRQVVGEHRSQAPQPQRATRLFMSARWPASPSWGKRIWRL